MKYIITERQYRLLTEEPEEILEIPYDAFNNDWDILQRFLERRGNPPYKIIGDLNLRKKNIESLGNLISVGGDLDLGYSNIKSLGNLQSVGGWLDLFYSKIKSLGNLEYVGSWLYLRETPLSKTMTSKEIRKQVKVKGDIFI